MPPIFAVFSYTGRKPALWLPVCAGENRAMCLCLSAGEQKIKETCRIRGSKRGRCDAGGCFFAFPGRCCGRVFRIFEKRTENIRKIIAHGREKVQRLRKRNTGCAENHKNPAKGARAQGGDLKGKQKHTKMQNLPGGFCERNLRFFARCGILFMIFCRVCGRRVPACCRARILSVNSHGAPHCERRHRV